jgi:Ca2+-binding EF-hand superfamily protein
MKPAQITVAALLAALSVPLSAADATSTASATPPQARSFSQLDTNQDGYLSFSEAFANPRLSNNFKAIDANADGLLSQEEIRAALGRDWQEPAIAPAAAAPAGSTASAPAESPAAPPSPRPSG